MSLKKVKIFISFLVPVVPKGIGSSDNNKSDTAIVVSNTETLTSTKLREPLIDD